MDTASLYSVFLNSSGVCTDSRKIEKGALFFALSGPHFDGNKFALEALEKGASAVVVDKKNRGLDAEKTIVVKNSLEALQQLASYHRKKLNPQIIALTGSNGKTTTKELINEVLSVKYNTLCTEGNLNNHIGVPLTLLKLNPEHQIGIIEMGANHPGEIASLSEIVKPNWGYITNFGKAHLEGFGNLEGVIKSKSELYRHLIKHNQNILINHEDQEQLKQTKNYKVYSFGHKKTSDFNWQRIDTNTEFVELIFQGHKIESKLYGAYNASNLVAALSFGSLFDVPMEGIQEVISSYFSKNNRSQLIEIHNTQLVLDAYNANPTSMQAALLNFDSNPATNKAVILGDMKELGSSAAQEHENIVSLCKALSFQKIILIGPHFYTTQIKDERVLKFEDLTSFTNALNQLNWPFDSILIKGSRAMGLESLIPHLKAHYSR